MPDPNDQAPKTWNVGGTPMMRSEDYRKQQAAEMADNEARLAEAARQYAEAQAAYFEALRAAPHSGHAAAHPGHAPHTGYAASPEPAKDELTDHNYDGIEEYDNPTPSWWFWILYGCIAYSVLHVLIVHFTPESVWKTPRQKHAAVEAAMLEKQFAELNQIPMGEAKILKIMAQETWLADGKSIFDNVCWTCHGTSGEGTVGPNLTDDVYLPRNVTTLMDIPNLIITGSANGQMPSQKNTLNENEIALVAAYAASLRGTALPEGVTGKDPEGEPIAPWPTLDDSGEVIPAEGGPGASAEPPAPTVAMADD